LATTERTVEHILVLQRRWKTTEQTIYMWADERDFKVGDEELALKHKRTFAEAFRTHEYRLILRSVEILETELEEMQK
jgi:hypothetical protein